MAAREARLQILRTAIKLFDAEGSTAVGIDRIIAEASVAKASFYRHFPSKRDLIVATLEARNARVTEWLTVAAAAIAAATGAPPALALFDVVQAWAAGSRFYGCAFLRAVFDSPADPDVRRVSGAHKRALEEWIAAGIDPRHRPRETAAALMVLLDGGVAQAFVHADPARIALAREVAATLLEKSR